DVVVAVEVGDRRHFDEILEAGGVLGEQREMEAGLAAAFRLALGAFTRGDIGFVTDDGVDALVLALAIELDRAKEIAVIGHGASIHALRLDELHQFRHPAGAVEQTVVRVAMEMNKRTLRHAWESFLMEMRRLYRWRRDMPGVSR